VAALVVFVVVPAAPANGQNRVARLNRFFSALVRNQQFNGNVLVAEDGRIVFEQSFGFADVARKQPNTASTSFPIASITKTLTATGILQLIEHGRVQLNDPVVKYLPDFPYSNITIQHLLSHTSGLPSYNAFFDADKDAHPDKVFTNADFLPGIVANRKPLLYQPGDSGNYDNINFIVLAEILERVSGMEYRDYIETHILKPAGMLNTTFLPLSTQYDSATRLSNFAFPHLRLHMYSPVLIRANTVPYVRQYWHAYRFSGFGDYVSTTHDLLKFDEALYGGRLIGVRLLEEAFAPILLNNGRENPDNFGLGWEIENDTSLGKVVYHSGAATGLSAVLLRNISRHQTVIVFDNTHYNAHAVGTSALRILNDQSVPYPKQNLAELYGEILVRRGAPAARRTLERFRYDTAAYTLTESDLNSLGYDLMGQSSDYRLPIVHMYAEAEEVLRQNTELFPSSANVYDSYGEVLLKTGRRDEAIRMYQRALQLNPGSRNAKMILDSLSHN